MQRRNFIKRVAVGAGSVTAARVVGMAGVGSLALMLEGCGKNISGWVVSITSGFAEIKSLLPDLGLGQGTIDKISDLIAKGVKIAQDFDAAYKAGNFKDAITLFRSLGSLFDQVRTDLGVAADNKVVKAALAIIGIARVAIAVLLQAQGQNQPSVLTAAKTASAEETAALNEIRRLAAVEIPVIH